MGANSSLPIVCQRNGDCVDESDVDGMRKILQVDTNEFSAASASLSVQARQH